MPIEMNGFDGFIGALNNIGKNLEKNLDKACARTAEIVRTYTVKGIRDQSFNFAPLSPKYAERKKALGGGNKILISGKRAAKGSTPSQHYVNSFAVEKLQPCEYLVGSNFPQAPALENGWEVETKTGSVSIPARPHLEPALKKTMDVNFGEEIMKAMEDSIRDR